MIDIGLIDILQFGAGFLIGSFVVAAGGTWIESYTGDWRMIGSLPKKRRKRDE